MSERSGGDADELTDVTDDVAGDSPVAAATPPLWPRLRRVLLGRPTAAQAVIALLCGVLAFALVTQVHAAATGGVRTARTDDLLGILADLDGRADRLRTEISGLQRTQDTLANGSDQGSAALTAAQQRAATLAILTGTVAARGPGIVVSVTDPHRTVKADVLLDAVQELRDAGAEALQIGSVRVVTSTSFTDAPAGIAVDGVVVPAPYRITAIGDARTMSEALGIPGGVLDTVHGAGATATVTTQHSVTVSALRRQPGAG